MYTSFCDHTQKKSISIDDEYSRCNKLSPRRFMVNLVPYPLLMGRAVFVVLYVEEEFRSKKKAVSFYPCQPDENKCYVICKGNLEYWGETLFETVSK